MSDGIKKKIKKAVIIVSLPILLFIAFVIYSGISDNKNRQERERAVRISEDLFVGMKRYISENYEAWSEISGLFVESFKNDDNTDLDFGYRELVNKGREDLAEIFGNVSSVGLSPYSAAVGLTDDGVYYVRYIFIAGYRTENYEIRELLFFSDNIKALKDIRTERAADIGDKFYGVPALEYDSKYKFG